MLEFIVVDHATQFPQNCAGCLSYTGPFVDTHIELAVHGRVYFCQSCVRRSARVLGLIKGRQQDRLLQADQAIRDIEKQLEAAQQASTDLTEQLAAAGRRETGLQARLDGLEARERTRAHQLAELMQAAGALA